MDISREVKLLLLGTGGSGKSTFLKQMRIIHGPGYSNQDKAHFTKIIYQNILMGIQSLIQAMETLKIQFESHFNLENAERVKAVDYYSFCTFESNIAEAILALWVDSGIQECYQRRREFQLTDPTGYFLCDFQRITDMDYFLNKLQYISH